MNKKDENRKLVVRERKEKRVRLIGEAKYCCQVRREKNYIGRV